MPYHSGQQGGAPAGDAFNTLLEMHGCLEGRRVAGERYLSILY